MDLVDIVVQCPYDKNHKIARSRIQRHLIKCEKNYPVGYKSICPYNATHRYFKSEMENHIQNCPQRMFMDPSIYQKSTKRSTIAECKTSESLVIDDNDENWDYDFGSECGSSNVSCVDSESQFDDRVPKWVEEMSEIKLEDFCIPDNSLSSDPVPKTTQDSDSEYSYVGMGRGKPRNDPSNLYKKIGFGRAKLLEKFSKA